MLYLTNADVMALDIDPEAVRRAVGEAFAAYGQSRVAGAPKASLAVGPGHAFQSLAAVNFASGHAAAKWIGMVPPGGAATVTINAMLLLSDVATGEVLCIMDGRHATGLRTAAMSAEAVRMLARPGSTDLGLVGAGTQALSHVVALARVLPQLRQVRIASRTAASAEKLAATCRTLGLAAETCTPEQAVAASDVVVSTVAVSAGFTPLLDAGWLRPGALAVSVDVGRSWKPEGLGALDLTLVDEEALKHYGQPGNMIPPLAHAQGTLAELACGRHPGRTQADQRILFVSSGSAVADLAIASLAYQRAIASGKGMVLPA